MSLASARAAAKNKPKPKRVPKPKRTSPPTDQPRGRGRPSTYTQELAERICERIALREPMSKIVADPEMPTEATIYRWRIRHPEFSELVARAREHRAEARADRIDEYIDEVRSGKLPPDAGRVCITGEQWQAGKENKRYSDLVRAEITGRDGADLGASAAASLDWLRKALEPAAPLRLEAMPVDEPEGER